MLLFQLYPEAALVVGCIRIRSEDPLKKLPVIASDCHILTSSGSLPPTNMLFSTTASLLLNVSE